jgi:FkbM family methyltransferase
MKFLRRVLRAFTSHIPFKGRYRLADQLGALIAGELHEVIELNGVHVELDHRILLHRMMYYGLYEENVVNHLRRTIRPGDVVFDPGANVGYFAAVCVGLVGDTGHVHSFEPSNTAFAYLIRNNPPPRPANWTVEHAALGDRLGTMVFYDTPRVITRGFACLEGVFEPKDGIPHPIEVLTLDEYCTQRNIRHITFLKLDIEGSELKALHGARRSLDQRAIGSILVETSLEPHLRPNAEAIDALLRSAGFRSFRALRNGDLEPIDVLRHRQLREDIIWTLGPAA